MDTPILAPASQFDLRRELEALVIRDLLGPAGGEHEEINEPSVRDRYLVGMLAPQHQQIAPEEQDNLDHSADSSEDTVLDVGATQAPSMFPSSLGLTCCIEGNVREVMVQARWGWYQREHSDVETTASDRPKLVWRRQPMGGNPRRLELKEGKDEWKPDEAEQPEVKVQTIVRRRDSAWIVSVFLVNGQQEAEKRRDTNWLFQPELGLFAADGAAIFRQRLLLPSADAVDLVASEEERAMAMRYRHQVEFAVGHGVSVRATLQTEDRTCATRITTCVIPAADVPVTTEPGPADAPGLAGLTLDMRVLAEIPNGGFANLLQPLVAAYAAWIAAQAARIPDPGARLSDFRAEAGATLEQCRVALRRIQAGIAVLDSNPQAADAFRFANRAMWQQRVHGLQSEARRRGQPRPAPELDIPANRSWRVFQLAFVLLNLPALTDLHHGERAEDASALADLLWYPTGGGKTEAYLGLTAYTLAIRRLQGAVAGRSGMDGVAVIMRYTLRLLTLQQFQRATALICACEMIRREAAAGDRRWGATPFRIGLWVGQRTTPNTTLQSKEAIKDKHQRGRPSVFGGSGSPAQLTNCPWCGSPIDPGVHIKIKEGAGRTLIYCGDPLGDCPFSERQSQNEGLPVLVVDEEIYRRLPALLIATVDKFAQLPWNGRTQMLFGQVDGYCERHGFCSPEIVDEQSHRALPKEGLPEARTIPHGPLRPPDLIIQDELHLISGPLGTLVGLYETAVDSLASWTVHGTVVRPKVIASTATVRRAAEQAHALFRRRLAVFPPPVLDVEHAFFAEQRPVTDDHPGRQYLGICAHGQRLKSVEVRVFTSLLAAAQRLFERYGEAGDPWMTLVT
ncbi:MAG TPA: DISARM system helicase DrmA, partial [Herpetosiphonaceae bacterium]|nr:DISARM system helicase DrmA [Herpetosiphonaceae bacterium]